MSQRLKNQLQYKLELKPWLYQVNYLLQLPTLKLAAELEKWVEENPVLEIEPNTLKRIDFFKHHETQYDLLDSLEIEKTLKDHLLEQLEFSHFSEIETAICICLIDHINPSGYLITPLCELLKILQKAIPEIQLKDIQSVLKKLQTFEPAGIGAENLKTCLQLQLKSFDKTDAVNQLALDLIENHLKMISQKKTFEIAQKLKLPEQAIRKALKRISQLNPKPGLKYSKKTIENLYPDLITVVKEGKWVIKLNEACMPRVKLNAEYQKMAYQVKDHDSKRYLQEKLKKGTSLLDGLQYRRQTLLKVSACIIKAQMAFLKHGVSAMVPLKQQDIAKQLNLPVSTLSRAIHQKSIATPRGVFTLKAFFSGKVGEFENSYSVAQIKNKILQIISAESKKNPLTDTEILEQLKTLGCPVIGRTTVRKYRAALKIPNAHQRKAH